MQIWEGEWDIGAAVIHGSASAVLADLVGSVALAGTVILSSGALVVTGRPSLADTAATVDTATHGIRN